MIPNMNWYSMIIIIFYPYNITSDTWKDKQTETNRAKVKYVKIV